MGMTSDIIDAALDYAQRGWRVVPTSSNAKHPPIKGWQQIASTDIDDVRRLFTSDYCKRTCDGVSVVLGKTTGIIDIETDSPEGEQQFVELFNDDLLVTSRFQSGSGRGNHYLFRYRDDLPDKAHVCHPGGLAIDFKLGTNDRATQSVFPPSAHKKGRYRWLAHPDDVGIAQIPDGVLRRIAELAGAKNESGNNKPASDRRKLYEQEAIVEGNRDTTLYAEACGLWREQHRMYGGSCFDSEQSLNTVFSRLWAWNRAKFIPPLDDEQVVAKCQNAREFIRQQATTQNDDGRQHPAIDRAYRHAIEHRRKQQRRAAR